MKLSQQMFHLLSHIRVDGVLPQIATKVILFGNFRLGIGPDIDEFGLVKTVSRACSRHRRPQNIHHLHNLLPGRLKQQVGCQIREAGHRPQLRHHAEECARYEALAKIILYSDEFYNFFKYVEVSTFDIASDAFSTFKELLTRHKMVCAEFLEQNYDKVFSHYQNLLNSENYVTRRQSLKLLGELLLDRHNFSIMTRYISNPENLKLMMNMLKEKSRNIQFEAFHVFKVFVANPNKPKPILDILLRNKDKLVDFLSKFHTDRSDDEQFNDEKAYLIKQIRELKPLEGDPTTCPQGGH
ncbi:hypothetical protein HPB51_009737 [Rhipicephalus microplus]|uniref:Protein Mo25 n=1 Tax=Rhipicephalus microplus TaxID=6941 RepID=A0A9J6F1C3_RHIMP|nr:hypothetical protein HPB51_009737 [Rhipicephalus microplus]